MDILTLTLNPCVDRTLWPDGSVELQSGGKGINVARVLSNLGVDCLALAPVGGRGGEIFRDLTYAEGIALAPFPIRGNTRTIDTYAGAGYGQQVVREPSPSMSPEELEGLEGRALELLARGPRAFCVCGSACSEEAAGLGAKLLRKAKEMGIHTLLDANGPMLILGAKAGPGLLKPNREELAQLLGRPVSEGTEEEGARSLLERGIGQVLLSLGEKGAMLVEASRTLYCPAPRVRTVNPVGSGDSFVAGYLHALLKGCSEYGALARACAAGAANAAMFPAARIREEDIAMIMGYRL